MPITDRAIAKVRLEYTKLLLPLTMIDQQGLIFLLKLIQFPKYCIFQDPGSFQFGRKIKLNSICRKLIRTHSFSFMTKRIMLEKSLKQDSIL